MKSNSCHSDRLKRLSYTHIAEYNIVQADQSGLVSIEKNGQLIFYKYYVTCVLQINCNIRVVTFKCLSHSCCSFVADWWIFMTFHVHVS